MTYLMAFEVVDDLALPGCPVCHGARRGGDEWLHGLLHEDANNPAARAGLDRDGGLCRDHLARLVAIASSEDDGLGLAIVLEALLAIAARRLHAASGRSAAHSRRGRAAAPTLTARGCGACETETRRATAYLDLILDASPGDDLHAAVDDPAHTLCLAHLEAALARGASRPNAAVLARTARRRVEQLQRDVSMRIRPGHPLAGDDLLLRDGPGWLGGAPSGRRPPDERRRT